MHNQMNDQEIELNPQDQNQNSLPSLNKELSKSNKQDSTQEREKSNSSKNSDIKINDIVNIKSPEDGLMRNGRILRIKFDDNYQEHYYYVHFLNFEKRMDNWIARSNIVKVLGNTDKVI